MAQVIRLFGAVFLLVITTGFFVTSAAQPDLGSLLPRRNYYVYVCAESDDEVAVVRYGPAGLEVIKTVTVGSYPTETEGPHGVALDPSGQYWYVSIAHGFPFGSVHKYRTGTDEWLGDVTLGMFPATLTVSATTGYFML